jgi:hypothetical protein
MINIFKRHLKKQRAVFSVNIDFSHEYKKKQDKLCPGCSYYSRNERKFTYDQLKSFVISTIEKDFGREVEEISGIPVYDIRVNRSYNGSIELVFTILFNAYQFIAGLKDFFDSLRLIRSTADKFLQTKLNDEYGDEMFDVNTSISYPNTDNYYYPEDLFHGKRGRYFLSHLIDNSNNNKGRDGFFYYLLFTNILLTLILIFMIYKAVAQTYGW